MEDFFSLEDELPRAPPPAPDPAAPSAAPAAVPAWLRHPHAPLPVSCCLRGSVLLVIKFADLGLEVPEFTLQVVTASLLIQEARIHSLLLKLSPDMSCHASLLLASWRGQRQQQGLQLLELSLCGPHLPLELRELAILVLEHCGIAAPVPSVGHWWVLKLVVRYWVEAGSQISGMLLRVQWLPGAQLIRKHDLPGLHAELSRPGLALRPSGARTLRGRHAWGCSSLAPPGGRARIASGFRA